MRSLTPFPLVTAFVSLLALSACSDSTGVYANIVAVRAEATPGFVRVQNRTAEPIYSLVLGREFAARANWAACVAPSACGEVLARQEIVVPDPNARPRPGAGPETEAIVFWWTAVRNGAGERVPGPVQSVIVTLR